MLCSSNIVPLDPTTDSIADNTETDWAWRDREPLTREARNVRKPSFLIAHSLWPLPLLYPIFRNSIYCSAPISPPTHRPPSISRIHHRRPDECEVFFSSSNRKCRNPSNLSTRSRGSIRADVLRPVVFTQGFLEYSASCRGPWNTRTASHPLKGQLVEWSARFEVYRLFGNRR